MFGIKLRCWVPATVSKPIESGEAAMYCVPIGASRRLRGSCLCLAAVMALFAVTCDAADARSRRNRPLANQQHASQTANPLYAAMVVDAKTGAILHQSNPDNRRHPASLTKIMTLYLLFERLEAGKLKLSTPLEVSAAASSQAPTKLGLKPGDSIKVEDAIGGLITKSANDAAVAVAEALAGSEAEFARQMTRKAHALGMRNTVYRNASGLPHNEQVTTARDQAVLGIAIQSRFPRYYRYFATETYSYRGQELQNHNRLLGRVEGVDGIKTGYTHASGFNLVSSVRRDGRHIVAVVLGGRSAQLRDARMRDLINSHIMEASTKGALTKIAETAEPRLAPIASQQMTAASAPMPLTPQLSEATAAIAGRQPGSTAPIKPIPVKTVTVKLVPARNMPPIDPAPVRSAEFEPMSVAALAPEPVEQTEAHAIPVEAKPVEAKPIEAKPVEAKLTEISPPAAKTIVTSAPIRQPVRHGWVIQVGALEDESEAKARLGSAQRKATSLLEKANAYTERTTKDGKTYYRARFAGFDRDKAEAACRQLKRSEIPCVPFKM
jgi:D-alanyl-D-alanine carboxypeptidase